MSSPSGSIVVLVRVTISSERLPGRVISNDAFGISLYNSTGITHSLGWLTESETVKVKSNVVTTSSAKLRLPVPFVQSATC